MRRQPLKKLSIFFVSRREPIPEMLSSVSTIKVGKPSLGDGEEATPTMRVQQQPRLLLLHACNACSACSACRWKRGWRESNRGTQDHTACKQPSKTASRCNNNKNLNSPWACCCSEETPQISGITAAEQQQISSSRRCFERAEGVFPGL